MTRTIDPRDATKAPKAIRDPMAVLISARAVSAALDLREDMGHSYAWWVKTAEQVDRGWRFFCRKRKWDPRKAAMGMTPLQDMRAEVLEHAARRVEL